MNTFISHTYTYRFRLFEIQIFLYFAFMSFIFFYNVDYVILYIAIELFSFSTILLTLFNNKKISTNIIIIYFFINAISSILILLGLFFYYYYFGISYICNIHINISNYLIILGIIIKLGSAPFHFWVLPLYDSISTIITLYQSIIPKLIYIFLIFHFKINNLIIISIILSFIIGSIIGIYQSKIKKLLAASSIVNLGFYFLTYLPYYYSFPLIINPFIFFIIYILNIINIFSIILFFKDLNKLKDLSFIPFNFPFINFLLMISILSLIGIPPLAGFFAKVFVITNIIFNINLFYFSLIIFSIIATIISAYYYLYIIIYTYNNNNYPYYNIYYYSFPYNSIIYIISISSIIIIIWPILNIYILNWLELLVI